ncbi:M23 family metallopeptidase [Mucilaginibacter sp. UR6-1]|uniref:M23 family metallopeptidase n=1 Tax=Mucilaginibacter sp. UR6-1 TaxID=1435643 RepID=UPI001E29B0E9|nr:M23 family metallopeptidase [Mucilaginibacter sp. UR6-1]MCC8407698.1 M23 family metallopeptidase [Mucilaginibacter sp. UR6-1]
MKALTYFLICLPLASLQISSPFGYRHHPVTGLYAFHNGVDFRARSDTVYALADAVVYSVACDERAGIHIILAHADFSSVYGHLSQVFVSAADTVTAGQPIGITGKTGRVTGEHLHFSIRAGGRWVDPLEFIYHLINTKSHE